MQSTFSCGRFGTNCIVFATTFGGAAITTAEHVIILVVELSSLLSIFTHFTLTSFLLT